MPCPACGVLIAHHTHERALQCLLILAQLAKLQGVRFDVSGQQIGTYDDY